MKPKDIQIIRLLATAIKRPEKTLEILSELDLKEISDPLSQKVYLALVTPNSKPEEELALYEQPIWDKAISYPLSDDQISSIIAEFKLKKAKVSEVKEIKKLANIWLDLPNQEKKRRLLNLLKYCEGDAKLTKLEPEEVIVRPQMKFRSRYVSSLELWPNRYTIIGGRPGMGKTTLSIQILLEAVDLEIYPIVISLELSPVIWMQKAIWLNRRVNERSPKSMPQSIKELEPKELKLIERAYFIESPVIEEIDQLVKATPTPRLVILDYIQLAFAERSQDFGSRALELGYISGILRQISKLKDTALIVCSQLRRAKTIPDLADLRDSGALEADADGVLLLGYPTGAESVDEASKYRIIYIAKNRYGPLDKLVFPFDGGYFP